MTDHADTPPPARFETCTWGDLQSGDIIMMMSPDSVSLTQCYKAYEVVTWMEGGQRWFGARSIHADDIKTEYGKWLGAETVDPTFPVARLYRGQMSVVVDILNRAGLGPVTLVQ